MTDNEKLARWQGLENVRPTRLSNGTIVIIYNSNEIVPDYLNDDAAAISLLDTLVEKGFYPKLFLSMNRTWVCTLLDVVVSRAGETRREAVVAAVLELIEKEIENDQTTEAGDQWELKQQRTTLPTAIDAARSSTKLMSGYQRTGKEDTGTSAWSALRS